MPVVKAFVSCLLTGKNFDPQRLANLSGLKFYSSGKKGELTRYNWKRTHGDAIISKAANINQTGEYIDLDSMLQVLFTYREVLKICGVEDISLTLNFFCVGDIASWHLEYEQLKKLVELGIGLSIDWYQFENEEEIGE